LLLRILHAWGAKPLVITLPFDGLFYDFQGVSAKARAEYYTRLHVLGARYGAAVAAFDDHEYDRLFFTDVSHPSMKGWVYYDQALDAFYHDTLQ
jgi:D-alanine transfer protein